MPVYSQRYSDTHLIFDDYNYYSYYKFNTYGAQGAITLVYTIAAIAELVRFIQTRNKIHFSLIVPAILSAIIYVFSFLVMINVTYMLVEINWIMIVVPTHLLITWLNSMTDHIQNLSGKRLRFVRVWFILFNIEKLMLLIFYSLSADGILHEAAYILTFQIALTIEIVGFVLLLLFCVWTFFEFQSVSNPEILLKRRQLLTILLLHLTLIIYFSTLTLSSIISQYIHLGALVAYFALTLVSRNSITGFDKKPNLAVSVPGQPTVMTGQTAIMMSQPTVMMNQPTFVPGQPTVMMGQPTFVPVQSTVVQGQPTIMPGRPL
jgi:hypothetical protein